MIRLWIRRTAWAVLAIIGFHAFRFWWDSSSQPLIDQHSFRQTQTALTALYLQPNLASFLNYQTPVLGSPWSLPFEFPFYQAVVAGMSGLLHADLSTCGRIVSIIFGVACLVPAIGLLQEFGFSRFSQLSFAALYLSSSIYLYWNRAFMIESTALFFTLLSLYLYALIRSVLFVQLNRRSLLLALGFGLSLAIALLIKATTSLVPMLLIIVDLSCLAWLQRQELKRVRLLTAMPVLIGLLAAFSCLRVWTKHADQLKSLSPLTANLTSANLNHWNFGTIDQRFSSDLWMGVFFQRMLTPMGFWAACLLLALGLWVGRHDAVKLRFVGASLALAVIPLLIFTNLHLVHNYYQAANQVFLLLALAASGSMAIESMDSLPWLQILAALSFIVFIISNQQDFEASYRPASEIQLSERLELGWRINEVTDPNSAILVLSDDWDSSFAYHTHRRALTLPKWAISETLNQASLLADPRPYLKPYPLGAIVSKVPLDLGAIKASCPSSTLLLVQGGGEWMAYICHPA